MRSQVLSISPRYREVIVFSLLQQIPIALISLLLLDGGRTARVCGIAMVGFWVAVFLMMARRPLAPDRSDLVLIRWGFVPLAIIVGNLASLAGFGP